MKTVDSSAANESGAAEPESTVEGKYTTLLDEPTEPKIEGAQPSTPTVIESAAVVTANAGASIESTAANVIDDIYANPEAAIRAIDAEDCTDTPVDAVAAIDSAPEPDAPEDAVQRQVKIDLAVKALIAKGFTPEQAQSAVAITAVNGPRQRRHPAWAPVNHAFARAFFADRPDQQLEGDMTKHIRNDGGQLGPVEAYARMMVRAGVDIALAQRAAKDVAAHVDRRIRAIRTHAIATINELRVRRLERAGGNVNDGVYLKAR